MFQTERMATLFIDVLRGYTLAGKLRVREFVVMRNHVHLLITLGKGMSIERAMQLIKGGFSYRAKKELGRPWTQRSALASALSMLLRSRALHSPPKSWPAPRLEYARAADTRQPTPQRLP